MSDYENRKYQKLKLIKKHIDDLLVLTIQYHDDADQPKKLIMELREFIRDRINSLEFGEIDKFLKTLDSVGFASPWGRSDLAPGLLSA